MKYGIYEVPDPKNKGQKIKHLRVMGGYVVSHDNIVEKMHRWNHLDKGLVEAVLIDLAGLMEEELAEGNSVSLEGIGTFSLQIANDKTRREVEDLDNVHAKTVVVKDVTFRASKELKQGIQRRAVFERTRYVDQSVQYSRAELESLLREYFKSNETMDRRDFQRIALQKPRTAQRRLKELEEEGVLVNIGSSHYPIYKPADGFMA